MAVPRVVNDEPNFVRWGRTAHPNGEITDDDPISSRFQPNKAELKWRTTTTPRARRYIAYTVALAVGTPILAFPPVIYLITGDAVASFALGGLGAAALLAAALWFGFRRLKAGESWLHVPESLADERVLKTLLREACARLGREFPAKQGPKSNAGRPSWRIEGPIDLFVVVRAAGNKPRASVGITAWNPELAPFFQRAKGEILAGIAAEVAPAPVDPARFASAPLA